MKINDFRTSTILIIEVSLTPYQDMFLYGVNDILINYFKQEITIYNLLRNIGIYIHT